MARAVGIGSVDAAVKALRGGRARAIDIIRLDSQVDGEPAHNHAFLFCAVGFSAVPMLKPWMKRLLNPAGAYYAATLAQAIAYRQPYMTVRAGDRVYKVHLDGYDQSELLAGKGPGQRNSVYYFDDNANFNAMRWNDWKIHFATQTGNIATGTREVPGWPLIVNLRADPYEKGPNEADLGYMRWYGDNMWLFVPVQAKLREFFTTIPDYPFQEGSSLSAGGINYNSLKAMKALNMLEELEERFPISN